MWGLWTVWCFTQFECVCIPISTLWHSKIFQARRSRSPFPPPLNPKVSVRPGLGPLLSIITKHSLTGGVRSRSLTGGVLLYLLAEVQIQYFKFLFLWSKWLKSGDQVVQEYQGPIFSQLRSSTCDHSDTLLLSSLDPYSCSLVESKRRQHLLWDQKWLIW